MTKKIFRSVFWVAIAILIVGISVTTSFFYDYYKTLQVKQLKAELELIADTVNEVGTEYLKSFDSSLFRFTLVNNDGTVEYDTEADTPNLDNHADREEIAEAFKNGRGSSSRSSDTFTVKTFYEAILLKNGQVLRISLSQVTVGALILSMLPAIVAIVLILGITVLVISNRIAKKVTEPLMLLDLENPTENNTYEELDPILNKLHKQHKQIKAQMAAIGRKSNEFQQIVCAMTEGLVLLDEHGMVLSVNDAAKHIFNTPNLDAGKDFLLIDRTDRMNRAVMDALNGKRSEYTEQRNGCEYQFTINPIGADMRVLGAVIFAVDISDRAFAERNRREFTANVTHELKTPLQSIIGSAELLENGLVRPEDTQRFAGNIRKEAARLVCLINDIIRLSQMDENESPAMEAVDIFEVAAEVAEVLESAAESGGIDFSLKGEKCVVTGVRRYIYEIIYNLCDNAIRYNNKGGKVLLQVGTEGDKKTITVTDTGIGIPKEHKGRIFERFYRVDKSHSKETGGTGLGLSIVKHSVAFHGGRVEIESEPMKGTCVKVWL